MAKTYVNRVSQGSNNKSFRVQVIDDDGNSSFKSITVDSENYISESTQNKIQTFLLNNAASLDQETLTSKATSLAKDAYTAEKLKASGEVTTEPTTWDKIMQAGASLLGITYDSPTSTTTLQEDYNKGNRSIIASLTDKPVKKITPYSDINKPVDATLALKDIIGGADLSVFFLMSFPDFTDSDNMLLPKDAQKKEYIIIEMDNALSVTYSIMREKVPVRSIGHINPRDVLNGPRTISGSLACVIYTNDVMSYLRSIVQERMERVDSKFKEYQNNLIYQESNTTTSSYKATNFDSAWEDSSEKKLEWARFKNFYQSFVKTSQSAVLLDSLPPFHLMIMGTNERGTFSKMLLKDVSIIDENQYQGTQQPHIINKITFTCKDIVPMAKFTNNRTVIASIDAAGENIINGQYTARYDMSSELVGSTVLNDLSRSLNSNTLDEVSG